MIQEDKGFNQNASTQNTSRYSSLQWNSIILYKVREFFLPLLWHQSPSYS